MDIRIESNTGINFLYSDCIQSKLSRLDGALVSAKSMMIKHLIDEDDFLLYRISVLIITDGKEIFKAGSGRDAHVILAKLLDECMPINSKSARLHSIVTKSKGITRLKSAS